MIRYVIFLILPALLSGCSVAPEKPMQAYRMVGVEHLQQQERWYFEGRVALVDERDSVSASISWRHNKERDDIELTGPLAQGKVAISVTAEGVAIDDGDSRQEFQGSAEAVLNEQLGVDMPVSALRYWVLGVSDPQQDYVELQDGFLQDGWSVRFREMQQVNAEMLPKKVTAEKEKARIKLIVDQWDLS